MKNYFKTRWNIKLKLFSAALIALVIYIGFFSNIKGHWVIIVLFILCASFSVRGYNITGKKFRILRIGWSTKFNLSELTNVEISSHKPSSSFRLWVVGKLFDLTFYHRNSALGYYQSYATNVENIVVLDFDGKKIIVSPEDPEGFVRAIQQALY